MDNDPKKELRWEAPDFIFHRKDVSWYWISIIIALALTAFGIWQKNTLFVAFVIIAEVIIFGWAKHSPKTFHFTLDKDGAHVDGKTVCLWNEAESFSLHEFDELSEITLKKHRGANPYVKLFAHNDMLPEIKKFLLDRLPEGEHEESLIDALFHAIKF